ncbi:MAG: hypothetical protein QG626_749, partial [Patescibacteria group bacterium]|nr:hypothetical protein [Patescibacteria group bacterium]
ETTIRTHKVTKPLIWLGLGIAVGGGAWYYSLVSEPILQLVHFGLLIMMIANGSYLSFWISPRLLERERQGKSTQLLPKSWKIMITLSFFVSILTWWTALFLAMVVITRT